MKKFFIFLTVLFAVSFSLQAQNTTPPPSITVTGEAEIHVAPDEAVFELKAETMDKDLLRAKTLNDEKTRKVLALAKTFQLDPQTVQSGYISVRPEHDYSEKAEKRLFVGYVVSRDITITLRDLTRFEDLFTEVVKAGITKIEDIQLQSSKAIEYRRKAKLMAIKAAQEKASQLVAELGQTIGKAIDVQENPPSNYTPGYAANANTTIQVRAAEIPSNFAPGQITIKASVQVKFELK